MNIHGIASKAGAAVNPMREVFIKTSTGYEIEEDGDGTPLPQYDIITVFGQIQPLIAKDLQKLQGLNIQGVTQKAYLTGNFEGLFRTLGKGGDVLAIGEITYLVTSVLERWPDWTSVAITAQVDN